MFDLDMSYINPAEVRRIRGARTQEEMSNLIGASEAYRAWEKSGVSNGWAALLREFDETGRDITPINCSIESLEALATLFDSYAGLARELGVTRGTLQKWRYKMGYVPGNYGYGRIVRICHEDIFL